MPPRRYASVDRRRCVSCGTCEKTCPRGAIAVWNGCFALVSRGLCVGCGKCSKACPADCITLKEREAEA